MEEKTKSEAKHTPGPWKSTVLRYGARIESDGASVAWVGPDDTRECADGRIVEVMTKRAVANARLIAAAPDLLEALKDLVECDCAAYELDAANCEHARARAAIARAEGPVMSTPTPTTSAEMLAEHRRTLGQLERMQVMTKHLAKTDPLAEEIAAAIKGTKAIIAKAEGGE